MTTQAVLAGANTWSRAVQRDGIAIARDATIIAAPSSMAATRIGGSGDDCRWAHYCETLTERAA